MHRAKKKALTSLQASFAKRAFYKNYRKWKSNLRVMLINENRIDEVAILTTELSSLRRDFKDLMFTSIVDLEERMDRRIERLAWLIQHNQKEVITHMSSRHNVIEEEGKSPFGSKEHAPFKNIVSGIPASDVLASIDKADHE